MLRPSVKEQLFDLLRSIESGGPGFNTFIYGAPGTGKTDIIRSLAQSTRLRFFAAGPNDLRGQYIGEASSRTRKIFETVRRDSPSILYMDLECFPSRSDSYDSFSSEIRCETLSQLDLMHGKHAPVFVIGDTFTIERVDPSVVARFGLRIEIPVPDESERREILKQMIRNVAGSISDLDEISAHLAQIMPGASGRHLNYVVRKATEHARKRAPDRDRMRLSREDLIAVAEAAERG